MNEFEKRFSPEVEQRRAIQYFFRSLDLRDGLTDRETIQADPNAAPINQPRPATASARVAATWSDPAVKEARNTKDAVMVEIDGRISEHRSTLAAFLAHSLPEKFHKKFRLELKRDGEKTFHWEGFNYKFSIVQVAK